MRRQEPMKKTDGEMPVYALLRSDGGWAVVEFDRREVLFEAPFVSAWMYANDLAARNAPAVVIALNDGGDVVARAMVLEPSPSSGVGSDSGLQRSSAEMPNDPSA
jgi:hypothetical protein